jgi:hypothetical protein
MIDSCLCLVVIIDPHPSISLNVVTEAQESGGSWPETVLLPDRRQPAYQNSLKRVPGAVSDWSGGVRRRGERSPRRGAPEPQEMIEMQYLVSVIHDKTDLGTADEMAAINVFNDRLEAVRHVAR